MTGAPQVTGGISLASGRQPRQTAALQEFLVREQLPDSYAIDALRWFQPLADQIFVRQQRQSGPLIVGVQGAQGTGKSTLAALLAMLLQQHHGLVVAQLSLDDFYLGHDQRQQLAEEVHPLLATRGVPGTHDTALAKATLDALCQAGSGQQVPLPRFDKATDDRRPESQWPALEGPVDVIILEGWCLGAGPQAESALASPINSLERERDATGDWRGYVNRQLAGAYHTLFARLELLVVLQAPSFDCVYRWRGLQEQKLAAQGHGNRVMDSAQLQDFIAHYERITRHCLDTLPALAQHVYQLDDDHRVLAETASL
jgi:D-glycerate 3-kinase